MGEDYSYAEYWNSEYQHMAGKTDFSFTSKMNFYPQKNYNAKLTQKVVSFVLYLYL